MKKILVVAFLVIATGCFAGDFVYWGTPGPTKTVYVDNVAKSLQTLYTNAGGTWVLTDTAGVKRTPSQVFITCESKATKWGFGGTTPTTTLGHTFTADSSWHLPGERYIGTAMGISTVVSDNVTCQMTPEY